jgi:mRNA interferase MazF
MRLIMICNKGDIVVIPFPFVDNANTKPRPAVVLSNGEFNKTHDHTVMAMITTGAGTSWNTDVKIDDLNKAGLKIASYMRLKIFTLDNRLIKKKIGKLNEKNLSHLQDNLNSILC